MLFELMNRFIVMRAKLKKGTTRGDEIDSTKQAGTTQTLRNNFQGTRTTQLMSIYWFWYCYLLLLSQELIGGKRKRHENGNGESMLRAMFSCVLILLFALIRFIFLSWCLKPQQLVIMCVYTRCVPLVADNSRKYNVVKTHCKRLLLLFFSHNLYSS